MTLQMGGIFDNIFINCDMRAVSFIKGMQTYPETTFYVLQLKVYQVRSFAHKTVEVGIVVVEVA